jgi:hypothetical protein
MVAAGGFIHLKFTLEVSGGFAALPQLSRPQSIDTEAIDPARARELESIVRDVDFFALPVRSDTTSPSAADLITYSITVQNQGREHTVELTDPVSDERLMRLIDTLRTSPRDW